MPIISTIGRRSPKVRALIWSIYGVLVLGAATMVYPFLVMVAGTTKSGADAREFQPLPSFVTSDTSLYRKHIEGLFNEKMDSMKIAYDSDEASFELIDPPANPNRAFVDEWREFLAAEKPPFYTHACGYVHTPVSRTMPRLLREFKSRIQDDFDGDLVKANRELGTEFVEWHAFFLLPESYLHRREKPLETPFAYELRKFKAEQPLGNLYYFSAEGFYKTLFLKTQYTRDIEEYNAQHGTSYGGYAEIHLTRRLPRSRREMQRYALALRTRLRAAWEEPAQGLLGRSNRVRESLRAWGRYCRDVARAKAPKVNTDWEQFARNSLNLLWIRADEQAAPLYRAFLKAKYRTIEPLRRNYPPEYGRWTFGEIPLPDPRSAGGIVLSDWEAFLVGWKDPDTERLHKLPAEMIYIDSVDFQFRDHLKRKYGSLAAVNQKFGTSFADFLEILPPQRDCHYLDFLDRRGELKWEFSTRNFRAVLDYLVFHGRGVINTVIYCTLAVAFSLLVNPLAAYAMSRYRMPTTYKILLFLMLTMAFPPMVTQIPSFLMLREMGLLNTFAALILPGLANGYSIFLLKGFFDSLPQELYESAALDGAGEIRIFWQITMSLSKPILAVIALGAFRIAYMNFMFALLICQDQKMWTLMVWLYQLQQRSGQGVMYAALIIAAIPTLIIFIFCQNIILRGIVVPVEK